MAVSGGGDSLALMLLLADWAKTHGAKLQIASVDHGLRPEAADEIAHVARLAAQLDLPHEVLRWSGWSGQGNLQAAARAARLQLLGGWARGRGLSHICLGHTLEDQAETLLLRLARGSGVDGLSAMAPARAQDGVIWLRPLLEARRADLRDELRRRAVAWCEDPSNEDPRFGRVRARSLLQNGADLGIEAPGLAETARRMRAARQVLAGAAVQAAQDLAHIEAGDVLLARAGLFALPEDTCWRLFSGALCLVSGQHYRPRFDTLRRALADLAAGRRATLHGCLCSPDKDGVRISREAAALGPPIAPPGLWDGRWHIMGPVAPDLRIAALGAGGLAGCPDWRETGLVRESLLVSPALWRGETLICPLLLDETSEYRAELAWNKKDFTLLLQSD
ncbi:MAG: tRNA lysidine(34) synthetase TilS [Mangrovicoccus sp.]|nr:tRNA lysidine(34) synthetase TilS [Mangrovicoccus sp.]